MGIQVVLKDAVTSPGANIYQLNLLDAASGTLVLDTFNSTQGTFPDSSCLHELFEAQAEANPTAPCIKAKGMSILTYKAVEARANQLAHLLISMGIKVRTPSNGFADDHDQWLETRGLSKNYSDMFDEAL